MQLQGLIFKISFILSPFPAFLFAGSGRDVDIELVIRDGNSRRVKLFFDALIHFPFDRPVIFRCDPGAETDRNRALAQLIYEKLLFLRLKMRLLLNEAAQDVLAFFDIGLIRNADLISSFLRSIAVTLMMVWFVRLAFGIMMVRLSMLLYCRVIHLNLFDRSLLTFAREDDVVTDLKWLQQQNHPPRLQSLRGRPAMPRDTQRRRRRWLLRSTLRIRYRAER